MADISQTPADVHIDGSNAVVLKVQFGETVTSGNCVYKKALDGKYYKADRVESSEAATFAGIVVDANEADGYGVICTGGDVNVGTSSALTVGQPYVLSDDGGISPPADLASLDHVTHLGYAITTDIIRFSAVSDIVTL